MAIVLEPCEDLWSALAGNAVVLFMNGTRAVPLCEQSALMSSVLGYIGVDFLSFDVFADARIGRKIATTSGCNSVPQLYLEGDLLGCQRPFAQSVVSGELGLLLREKDIRFDQATLDFIRAALAQRSPFAKLDGG